jgi:hypothetical protein
VYHTADGGTTWSLITGLPYSGAPAGAAFPGGCWMDYATDFAVGPVNAQTGQPALLAVFGRVNDAACDATPANARKNNGIYRSVDGGVTWTKIGASGANGFPAIPGSVGRIALLLAPSNPKHAYALLHNSTNGNSLGIFITSDITAPTVAWTAGSTTNYTSAQGWYDMTGSVDPTDENRLMVGGLDNYMSTDGGATLTQESGWSATDSTWSHADHHHAVWVDANTYYDANDGGFFIGHIDGTNVTWEDKNKGALCTLQFYGLVRAPPPLQDQRRPGKKPCRESRKRRDRAEMDRRRRIRGDGPDQRQRGLRGVRLRGHPQLERRRQLLAAAGLHGQLRHDEPVRAQLQPRHRLRARQPHGLHRVVHAGRSQPERHVRRLELALPQHGRPPGGEGLAAHHDRRRQRRLRQWRNEQPRLYLLHPYSEVEPRRPARLLADPLRGYLDRPDLEDSRRRPELD